LADLELLFSASGGDDFLWRSQGYVATVHGGKLMNKLF